MRLNGILAAGLAAALMVAPSFVLADDWVATRLRGGVMQLVGDQWVKLQRGDIVADARVIRTLKTGRVTFERDNETIELGTDTQVRIRDKAGRRFTTVQQDFGTVAVEADVRQVEHFAVSTPHLAAIVKGTKFTVVSGERGARVTVQRGHVAVEDSDTHQSTLLAVGQTAQSADGMPLEVAGKGTLPTVFGANGKPVTPEAARPGKAGAEPVSPKAAAAAARDAALAGGASKREADRAARDAEKTAREEAKAARAEARAADHTVGPAGDTPRGREQNGPAGGPGGNSGGPGPASGDGPGHSGPGGETGGGPGGPSGGPGGDSGPGGGPGGGGPGGGGPGGGPGHP